MKNFHRLRGRSAEAEDFYQKLAALDPKDTNKIEKFKDTMGEILPPKTEETRGYGCW
ncbi:hypothetical protein Lgor_2786 [Fluoribacter gormanii]|uniref:Tetratricopeptide repeat protein n=1 Tax=Fluoribacter gormanii TaxID=464 RepID=A0A377GJM0_9GAMM|nr:hypothetical protein Lgor_2786 [Fluoribacter gormanii]SIQ80984.1 hypothetical protein SAMN05421777_103126 [Fluoribacter gormanii]STO25016.1 Uncharacterised protein [Fluoribacter gormanii]